MDQLHHGESTPSELQPPDEHVLWSAHRTIAAHHAPETLGAVQFMQLVPDEVRDFLYWLVDREGSDVRARLGAVEIEQRYVFGKPLTDAERQQLERWYEEYLTWESRHAA